MIPALEERFCIRLLQRSIDGKSLEEHAFRNVWGYPKKDGAFLVLEFEDGSKRMFQQTSVYRCDVVPQH